MSRKISSALILAGASFLLTACGNTTGKNDGFRRVQAEEFREIIQDTAVVVIDVRTAGEHAEGYIPGTDLNLDVLQGDFRTEVKKNVPENATIAIYCRSGNRSQKAAAILEEEGFGGIELSTGYKGWKELEERPEVNNHH